MIAKLRRRLILIMMALVAIVLIVTFSVLVISSAQQLKQDSTKNLNEGYARMSTKEDMSVDPPPDVPTDKPNDMRTNIKRTFDNHSPFSSFYLTLDAENNISYIDDFSSGVAEDDVQTALDSALAQGAQLSTINNLGLRYQVYENASGSIVIGFIDISFEQSFVRAQILSYTLIGLGSLAAFFIISLIISRLAIRPIDRAWKKQQQFIADASHELRTPITIMLANTSILQSDKPLSKAESDKWLSHIDAEARHMKKLIEDLLFLARIDAKDIAIPLTRIDLSDTAFESVLPFEPVVFESGKELVTDIEPGLMINGNLSQIKQLISILLDNARKYAYPDSLVTFRLKKENNKAVLSVNNAANPIDPKDIPHLFDRFYRADQARTRGTDSYGLGLSIAKEIVDMHKGKITIISNLNNGTTFSIALPIVE